MSRLTQAISRWLWATATPQERAYRDAVRTGNPDRIATTQTALEASRYNPADEADRLTLAAVDGEEAALRHQKEAAIRAILRGNT